MKQIKLDTNTRQSGKTYRAVGKYLKFVSFGHKVLYLTINQGTKKNIAHQIISTRTPNVPEIITFNEFDKDKTKYLTKFNIIIIDDWSYYMNIEQLKKLVKKDFKHIKLRGETSL